MENLKLETVVSWAKRRGFTYPGSHIYGGLANSWDLGPYGAQLRKNIYDLWWKHFVQKRPDVIGLDAAILMNPKVWVASGHVGGFSDPLIDCKKCKSRFRADKIIEEKLYQIVQVAKNSPWSDDITKGEEESYVLGVINAKHDLGLENMIADSWDFDKQRAFFDIDLLELFPEAKIEKIKCESCGGQDWADIKKFNLMFKTKQGVLEDSSADVYLRPETAQGIFVNFKNITDTTRMRVPFGIAQIGKAFRNEITPGNFLFRLREFEQMEIEYFVEPEKDEECFEDWKKYTWEFWVDIMGINPERLRLRDHESDELSHYSKGTTDIEYEFPWGWGELCAAGARRTDFDLKQHMEHSGENMQYTDPKSGRRYVPYVVEPSFGLTRAIVTAMIDAYDEETYTDPKGNEQTRIVARFHKDVAPVKFAVLPLMEKKEEIMNMAKDIFAKLSDKYLCEFDSSGNIGKRYRRQDEIGTPYCITVDYDSLEDGTVTIRDRDTMEQKRIKVEEITL